MRSEKIRSSESNFECCCGSIDLEDFSAYFYRCKACGTLLVHYLDSERLDDMKVRFSKYDKFLKNVFYANPDASFPPPSSVVDQYKAIWRDRLNALGVQESGKTGILKKVLEIGCGLGHLMDVFYQMGYQPTGVDINANTVAWAKANYPQLQFICAPFEKVKLDANSYDVIVAAHILQHVLSPFELLNKTNQLLALGGRLIIATIVITGDVNKVASITDVGREWGEQTTTHWFTEEGLMRLLSRFGFIVSGKILGTTGDLVESCSEIVIGAEKP